MLCFRDVHWHLDRSTAPASEPVSLSDIKDHCEYDDSDKDSWFLNAIATAREMVETDSELSLMSQTWKLYLDRWPADYIELRRPPITAVSSIEYVDAAGDTQTWASANYSTDLVGFPGRVFRGYGKSWPTLRATEPNTVTVTFTAGYSGQNAVPQLAKHAIRLLVGHWFDNRETIPMGDVGNEIALTYTALIRRLKWDL